MIDSASSLLPNALASAAAGIVSRCCTHPLDTAKARLQAQPGCSSNGRLPYTGPLDVLVRTARTEGIRGLYRGFGAVVIGGTPGTVLYLCSYEIAKHQLSRITTSRSDNNTAENFVVHFCSGMIAETIACLIYVPVDVIKERMQVQQSISSTTTNSPPDATYYRNGFDAMKQISRSEGLSGIYRGYGATLASFGPFSALYFVFYEKFKALTQQHYLSKHRQSDTSVSTQPPDNNEIEIPFLWIVLCSASAGGLASWLTSPLDMAKLRLQIQRGELGSASSVQYKGVVNCLKQSFQNGGVRGLFRGAGARVLHFAPATTVTISGYEFFSSCIRQHLNTNT